jgi:hypothetical protein
MKIILTSKQFKATSAKRISKLLRKGFSLQVVR